MLNKLPPEILLIVFSNIKDLQNILNLRLVCNSFRNLFTPINYINKNVNISIHFLNNEILWKLNNSTVIKKIEFKKYGKIRINIFNKLYFNDPIDYTFDLPKKITKTNKIVGFGFITTINDIFDLDKNTISKNQSQINIPNGFPNCCIS